ncbi:uncharacterized protein VTP21DRAFT_9272 [Calcarisporiella thermophila]|uniref:uncharacterized protein n=1 Tax=Calcarisporiella thermophila TaxID=911321 RepID=UPI003743A7A2
MKLLVPSLLGLSFLSLAKADWYSNSKYKKVLLRDVQSITLRKGEYTTARRSTPIPQLSCIGSACRQYSPDVIQCKNMGWDGQDVQWKCEADLPTNVKFGELSVSCEGYSYSDDDYILVGSCGLEYELKYTSYNSGGGWGSDSSWQNLRGGAQGWKDAFDGLGGIRHGFWRYRNNSFRLISFLLSLAAKYAFYGLWFGIFGITIFSILSSCLRRPRMPEPARPPGFSSFWGGWWPGGGGGGGGWWPGGGGGGGGYYPSSDYCAPPSYGPSMGSGSGFWTGAGLGGMAGYALGSRHRNQQERREREFLRQYGGMHEDLGTSSSSFSSTPTRRATGYGGTRRR